MTDQGNEYFAVKRDQDGRVVSLEPIEAVLREDGTYEVFSDDTPVRPS